MTIASAGKLPVVHKEQLAPTWRSARPLVIVGVRTELDEAAAAVLATLAETHGIATRLERPEALTAANLAKLDLSDVALICLSSVDMKTPAHIHYAARRLKSRTPHATLLLGGWAAKDNKALTDLKDAVHADYVLAASNTLPPSSCKKRSQNRANMSARSADEADRLLNVGRNYWSRSNVVSGQNSAVGRKPSSRCSIGVGRQSG